jgi:hypothetical protein
VNVAPGLAKQVADYTDEFSTLHLLAPNGWRCRASFFEDGGATFAISPPWENSPGFYQVPQEPWHVSKRVGITLYAEPVCGGCLLSIACPYFASARKAGAREGFTWALSCRPPRREEVRRESATLVRAIDPPGVVGNSWPTWGPYEAISEISYSGFNAAHPRGPYGASELTCTLPRQDGTLCVDTLAWFEHTNRY